MADDIGIVAEDPPPRRVAEFPRPPALERERRRVSIVLGGETIAETNAAWRVLETTHPPTYYLPRAAFRPSALSQGTRRSVCEWKGVARYVTLRGGDRVAPDAGWTYPAPLAPFEALADHVAVYAGRMDACRVGRHVVVPQPGDFYGGWITPDVLGPFKGAPGTLGW